MKNIFIVLIITLLFSCQKKNVNQIKTESKKELEIEEEQFYIDCKEEVINGIKFKACLKRPGLFTIENSKKEIIYKQETPSEFKFSDFNEDGYLDIILEYLTQTPGSDELLLFNKKSNSFEKVIDFMVFPSAIKIKNSELYYSYHKSGCADSNWGSDLFKIENNKAIRIGNMQGIGCGIDEESGIYINKVFEGNLKLVKYIKRDEGYWDGKWEFIEKYWTENYKSFK